MLSLAGARLGDRNAQVLLDTDVRAKTCDDRGWSLVLASKLKLKWSSSWSSGITGAKGKSAIAQVGVRVATWREMEEN